MCTAKEWINVTLLALQVMWYLLLVHWRHGKVQKRKKMEEDSRAFVMIIDGCGRTINTAESFQPP